MAGPSLFASAAHRWARARRWLLSGNAGPFLARYAPSDLPTPDTSDGVAAIRVWARWRVAELLDEGLGQLTSLRIQRGTEALGVPGAFRMLAADTDREAAADVVQRLSRAARAPSLALASALARGIELASQRGAAELADPAEVEAAQKLLRITEEPVRDVLTWASLRNGRPRRAALALGDVLRVLRSVAFDGQFQPAHDPWPALLAWREQLGLGLPARTEVAERAEAWPGSWALRGRRSRLVGTSGWQGSQRARFALQGLGRLDVLSESGHAALLPQSAAAIQLLEAAYPMLLPEPGFLGRVFGSGGDHGAANADDSRLLALAELLLQRLQAAAVQLRAAFEVTREVGAVLDAASAVSRALFVPVPVELAVLVAAPWSDGPSAGPCGSLAAALLIADWRESFDEDFWRNPRFGETLRALASRSAQETLGELVPGEQERGPGAYARWTEASLGR